MTALIYRPDPSAGADNTYTVDVVTTAYTFEAGVAQDVPNEDAPAVLAALQQVAPASGYADPEV